METSGGFMAAGDTILRFETGIDVLGEDTDICDGKLGGNGEGGENGLQEFLEASVEISKGW